MCRAGCRMTSTCPIDQYCHPTTKVCTVGCEDASNCTPGKACTSFTNGTKKCDVYCNSISPCAAGYECFYSCPGDSFGISCSSADTQAARCRKPCAGTGAGQCGAGEICSTFLRNRSLAGSSWMATYCTQPCTTTDYCGGTTTGSGGGAGCACQADGKCRSGMTGQTACYITNPSSGK
jgi:hypothetical protein